MIFTFSFGSFVLYSTVALTAFKKVNLYITFFCAVFILPSDSHSTKVVQMFSMSTHVKLIRNHASNAQKLLKRCQIIKRLSYFLNSVTWYLRKLKQLMKVRIHKTLQTIRVR